MNTKTLTVLLISALTLFISLPTSADDSTTTPTVEESTDVGESIPADELPHIEDSSSEPIVLDE